MLDLVVFPVECLITFTVVLSQMIGPAGVIILYAFAAYAAYAAKPK